MLSDIEREYSPSSVLQSLGTTLETEIGRYVSLSNDAYETHKFAEITYGPKPRNNILILDHPQPPKKALIYVHGGYWQELSARDSLFGASDALRNGLGFGSIGYTLTPNISLRAICHEIVSAIRAIRKHFPGTDLILAGSSAGAHLCAWVLHEQPLLISEVILMSGIYDLRPLVGTYINAKVGLSIDEAAQLSPLLLTPPNLDRSRVTIAVGEFETNAFREQSEAYARIVGVECTSITSRHHFDLPFELGRWLTRPR